MKSFHLAILVALLAPAAYSQSPLSVSTPAQQAVTWAEAAIKENPDRSQSYNDLALAYIRRVRETSDTSYYEQAQAALQKSLQMSPENFEARKAEVMILLGRKEFTKALELATALNKKTPDDVMVYGLVADADIELGNYDDAERAAQWMLDMRPGNVPGLLRGARLRRLFGDAEGAMDFYNQAYQQTPPTQTEDLAWILTQMADLQGSLGNVDGAEKLLRSALDKFPNYYLRWNLWRACKWPRRRLRRRSSCSANAIAISRRSRVNTPWRKPSKKPANPRKRMPLTPHLSARHARASARQRMPMLCSYTIIWIAEKIPAKPCASLDSKPRGGVMLRHSTRWPGRCVPMASTAKRRPRSARCSP